MTNMNLLDQFVGNTNHVIRNLEHSGGVGDVMIEVVVVFLFDLFQSMLESEVNELVEWICSIEFVGGDIFDLRETFENEFKLGVKTDNIMIHLGVKLCYIIIERVNFGNNRSNVVSEF